ncbi:MAG: O-antigen ligase family protein [Dehalococcoidia bacterium]|nr:O-antigen ligase family protein [Dehalococcoidia bacterium]
MKGNDSSPGMSCYCRLDSALEITWLLLIFLLPLYFNPFGYQVFYFAKALLLQFGVCLLAGLFLARWFISRKEWTQAGLLSSVRQTPLQVAVILFGLCWIASTAFSIMPESSLWGSLARKNGLVSIVAWIVLFFILALSIRRRVQLLRVLAVVAASAGAVSLFGILEFADPWLLSWLSRNGRISSTDGNPLSLSCFIAISIPVTLALIKIVVQSTGSSKLKALKTTGLLLSLILQVICLFLAQYSITILLFVPGIFIYILVAGVYLKKKAILTLSIIVLLALFLTATVIVGQTLLQEMDGKSVGSYTHDTSLAGQAGLPTLSLRVKQWECAARIIIDSPEVPFYQDDLHLLRRWMGYGPETFVIVSQTRYPQDMKSTDTHNSVLLGQPENHYLYLATTVGVLGLAFFLTIVITFFYLALRFLARTSQKDMIYTVAAFIAGMAQYCIYIMFNPTAILPEFFFWLILALMVAQVRIDGCSGYIHSAASSVPKVEGLSEKTQQGKIRKISAVLVIIVFIGIGVGLTLSPLVADMKLNSALIMWADDSNKTMTALAEAAKLEPGEAVYYGHIGAYAFRKAIASNDAEERSKLMALSIAAYEAAGQREPYLAYWSYVTGDTYSYWASHSNSDLWSDAFYYYQRANALLPENAVILNKWSLALMMSGNHTEAERMLMRSREADVEWVQTIYYLGVLDIYNHCYCPAANCYLYPVKTDYKNFRYYMDFCRDLALYGGIDKVVEGLQVYTNCHPDDWVGQTLLGVAEVYSSSLSRAADSFRRAADSIPPEDVAVLEDILINTGSEQNGFQPFVKEIIDVLAAGQPADKR